MTDNFRLYREFITKTYGGLPEDNEHGNLDRYFVVELIRRGKDNPDKPSANYHFKNYYIYSWRDLDRYEQEIKDVCTLLRLRAYASVNYKLMTQVALDTLAESARRIAAHDHKKFYSIFESMSAKYVDRKNQTWIVDVDDPSLTEETMRHINECQPKDRDKMLFEMPTKSGTHLITTAFNINELNLKLGTDRAVEIKKNHLTLLYENLT